MLQNDDQIVVKGARVHNLKGVDVALPREKFVVITGPSGSGKSSLAFDTIYAEGQRRYIESMSAYARQFIEQMSKPELDSISGLSPTISIEQKTTSYNPRSTVGTVTEVYDYLRLLYARIGKPLCYNCGKPIHSQSPQQIVDSILAYPENSKLAILAPIAVGRKGEFQKEIYQLRQRGFVRVFIDGEVLELNDDIQLEKNKKHDIYAYVDRLVIKGDRANLSARVSDSVDLALRMGKGMIVLENHSVKGKPTQSLLSEKFACTDCGISYPEPEPRTFSFNSPAGYCPKCEGLGVDPAKAEAAEELDADIPLTEGLVKIKPCTKCDGLRLRKESLHFFLDKKNIAELAALAISDLKIFFDRLKLNKREEMIVGRIIKEVKERLQFLENVGTGYISLSRPAKTLSGGEAQRIRLATQIGSSLVGVIYVLDEPSIGLHPRDHRKLLDSLKRLRDLGNTVLVVEHDQDTIEMADWIVDLGPGAGNLGGEVTAEGNLGLIKKSKKSLTGKYLTGELTVPVPKVRRPITDRALVVKNAVGNNLKDLTVPFPLGIFTCVTGVSGSGKSTLVIDTLYRSLLKKLYKAKVGDIEAKEVTGLDLIDKVIDIDQSPIGRTPRSNPATYTGLFSLIRNIFAQLPEAQVRGYKPGRFSFNVKGGRCEDCEGGGIKKVEMHFLPNVYVECKTCKGTRYSRETLEVRYKGKNIAEVLNMTAAEALEFFDAVPMIKPKLKILNDVGLGYVHLGQSATTLSGGEAQRIKLAKELSRRGTGKTVYILDEPSTGLHFDDIQKLVKILQALVDQGNTVIVIEHNIDIIRAADHVIDLGPEGGAKGGKIIASGTPEELKKNKTSITGKFI